jgi:hypothetical protein
VLCCWKLCVEVIQTGKGGIDGGSVYQLCVCMYIPCGDFSACSSA